MDRASSTVAFDCHEITSAADTGSAGRTPDPEPVGLVSIEAELRKRQLADLSQRAEEIRAGRLTYLDARGPLLNIHFALNAQQALAPAFRPLVMRRWFREDPVGDQIFVDQLLVDMHWAISIGRVGVSEDAKAISNG